MNIKYEPVIGLEVHAQLLTRTKMFCSCESKFGAEPNTLICPVCTAQPGALPTVNKKAVDFAIRAGLSMHCSIREKSIFARKNYFYPDLPKGYQISQFDLPICEKGYVDIDLGDKKQKRISITRIHMEEDAGKLLHDFGHEDSSHVDYNRSGVPLIEIVSGPDIRSPEEASAYLKTLRNILVYLEICDGNMQEGSFRCDANISVRPVGTEKFGTRTELKNLNSFKAVASAIQYEIDRQSKLLNSGGTVIQETLLWNEAEGKTESMRSKEEAHDYRYFPEPDLPPLIVDEKWIQKIRETLPELADAKAARFEKSYGLPSSDVKILTQEKELADYYEKAVSFFNSPKKISNWIMTELLRELNAADLEISASKISPKDLARLVELIENNVISGKMAKGLFEEMFKEGKSPDTLVKEKGVSQVTDTSALEKLVDEIMAANPDNVAKYRSGKTGVFGFFVGEAMKATKGSANPKIVNEILKKKLENK